MVPAKHSEMILYTRIPPSPHPSLIAFFFLSYFSLTQTTPFLLWQLSQVVMTVGFSQLDISTWGRFCLYAIFWELAFGFGSEHVWVYPAFILLWLALILTGMRHCLMCMWSQPCTTLFLYRTRQGLHFIVLSTPYPLLTSSPAILSNLRVSWEKS